MGLTHYSSSCVSFPSSGNESIPRALLDFFDPISLEEMGKVRLMNRLDTKFVAPAGVLASLLEAALPHYFAQTIDGLRNMPYSTCYFDTADLKMYTDHERGKKCRKKVRIRRYEATPGLAFFEIKDKNNKGRTKKSRIGIEDEADLEPNAEFLGKHSEF